MEGRGLAGLVRMLKVLGKEKLEEEGLLGCGGGECEIFVKKSLSGC